MSASIKTLADGFDNEVYPKTKTAAVYDDNDNLLDTILSAKQNSTDSNLNTTAKTVVGAINEVDSDLGSPSSASAVTGADAFSKISTLNSDLVHYTEQTFTTASSLVSVLSQLTPQEFALTIVTSITYSAGTTKVYTLNVGSPASITYSTGTVPDGTVNYLRLPGYIQTSSYQFGGSAGNGFYLVLVTSSSMSYMSFVWGDSNNKLIYTRSDANITSVTLKVAKIG